MLKQHRRVSAQYQVACANLLQQFHVQGICVPDKTKQYLQDVHTFHALAQSLVPSTNVCLGQSLSIIDSLNFVANTADPIQIRPWRYVMVKETQSLTKCEGSVNAEAEQSAASKLCSTSSVIERVDDGNKAVGASTHSCKCTNQTAECWCNAPRFQEHHLFVCFIQMHTDSTIQTTQWDKLLNYFVYLGAKRVCLITHNTLNPLKSTTVCDAKSVITRIRQEQLSINCISFNRLCHNPGVSTLSPFMKRLSEAEKQAWCLAHPHVDIKRLQRLCSSDPLCQQYGFEAGDLVYAQTRALEVDYFYVIPPTSSD